MKTKTIFRKPRVIITALVLAVLVALAAVVMILAADEATFAGVRVTTSGKLNMEFYYTINGANDGVTKARVEIRDGDLSVGEAEYVDLVSVGENKVVAIVRLDAAEMGYTVTVTPVTNDGEDACAPQEWSIRKYAEAVLANPNYAADYAPLKAVLNYGKYAKEYFANVQEYPFSPEVEDVTDGIFTRDTNPITRIASKLPAGVEPVLTSLDETLISKDSLELAMVLNDTIELRLYYAYTGESDAHTGAANYDEAKGKYFVKVGLIDTEHFGSDYGVKLGVKVNGNTVVTVENATVLNFISKLAAEEETKNVALAMYYYYYWTNDESVAAIDQNSCAHATHFESTSIDSGVSTVVCSLCAKDLDLEVNDNINWFSAPSNDAFAVSLLNAGGYNDYSDAPRTFGNIQYEDFAFTRVQLSNWGRAEILNGSAEPDTTNTLNSGNRVLTQTIYGSGRFFVIKMRAGSDVGTISLAASTGSVLNWTFDHNTRTAFADGWAVYVIDLSSGWNQCGQYTPGVDSADKAFFGIASPEDATGPNDYLDIAYFAVCDNFEEIKSVVTDEEVIITNWADNNVTKVALTDYTCSGEHKTYVEETVVSKNGQDANVCYTNVVTTYCTYCNYTSVAETDNAHCYEYVSVGNNVYNVVCTECDRVNNSVTVGAGDGINWFSAPSNDAFAVSLLNAGGVGNNTKFGNIHDEDVIFSRVQLGEWGRVELLNGSAEPDTTNTIDSGNRVLTQTIYGSGRFFVIKMRAGSDVGTISLAASTGSALNWTFDHNQRTAFAEGWAVYVIDLSKGWNQCGQYTPGVASADKAFFGIASPEAATGPNDYLDIAYFAVCDNFEEIMSIVTDEEVIITNWADNNVTKVALTDYTCSGEHKTYVEETVVSKNGQDANVCYTNVVTTYCTYCNYTSVAETDNAHCYEYVSVGNNVYNVVCTECDRVNNSVTVGAGDGINWLTVPSNDAFAVSLLNAGGVGNGTKFGNLNYDDGVKYTRVQLGEWARAEILNGSVEPDTTAGANGHVLTQTIYGSGNFLVIKMRAGADTNSVGLVAIDNITNTTSADWIFEHNQRTEFAEGWAVYVINMSQFDKCGAYNIGADSTMALLGLSSQEAATGPNDYLDIAYFAVCDSWEEIKSIVTDEQVVVTSWADNNVTKTNLADYND